MSATSRCTSDADVQLCWATGCTQEVFVACPMCEGFLCQSHFDDGNPCSDHRTSTAMQIARSSAASPASRTTINYISGDQKIINAEMVNISKTHVKNSGNAAVLIGGPSSMTTPSRTTIVENMSNISGDQTQINAKTVNISHTHVNSSPDTTCSTDLKDIQTRLRGIYKHRRRPIKFLGLPDKFDIEEFFAELKLLKEQIHPSVDVKKIALEKYTDLLTLKDTRDNPLKHVVVQGFAGTGKTTLISRLAYHWATQDSQTLSSSESIQEPDLPLRYFDLLFVLDVRKFKSQMDLIDTIKDQLLPSMSKETIESYLVKHGDKCLFLIDGYDELSSETSVFNDPNLCLGYVIVTTRTHTAKEFSENSQGFYVHVELEGFSEESVKQFIYTFFGHVEIDQKVDQPCHREAKRPKVAPENKDDRLIQKLESSTLCTLKRFPLLLTMMCIIWKDEEELPDTRTALFKKAVDHFARHWKQKGNTKVGKMSFKGFKEHVRFDSLLRDLGATALEGIFNKVMQFKEEEFDEENVVKGCDLGLVSKGIQMEDFEEVVYVCFIHKTFMEYCAGVYWASLVESGTESELTKFEIYLTKIDIPSILQMEDLLRFCCGTSTKAAFRILNCAVLGASQPECQWNPLLLSARILHRINNRIWSLPFILVFECEAQCDSVQVAPLHRSLFPLTQNLLLNSLEDSELQLIMDNYANKNTKNWSETWFHKITHAKFHVGCNIVLYLSYNLDTLTRRIVSMSNLKRLSLIASPRHGRFGFAVSHWNRNRFGLRYGETDVNLFTVAGIMLLHQKLSQNSAEEIILYRSFEEVLRVYGININNFVQSQ